MREIVGHEHFLDPPLPHDLANDSRETRGFHALMPELMGVMSPGEDAAMARLLAGAVDLQFVHHDMASAVDAEINEGIGDKHPHGVEHIGVMLAVGHHQ